MRAQTLCCLLAGALVAGASACAGEVDPTTSVQERFQATLSGANEVPAVTTTASGVADFWIVEDTFLVYRLDVAAVDNPIGAHIHEGGAAENGGVIVTLYTLPAAPSLRPGPGTTGTLHFGQVKVSQLTQLPAGYGTTLRDRFDSLLSRMRLGTVYVNVHTVLVPEGLIRGQVMPR